MYLGPNVYLLGQLNNNRTLMVNPNHQISFNPIIILTLNRALKKVQLQLEQRHVHTDEGERERERLTHTNSRGFFVQI